MNREKIKQKKKENQIVSATLKEQTVSIPCIQPLLTPPKPTLLNLLEWVKVCKWVLCCCRCRSRCGWGYHRASGEGVVLLRLRECRGHGGCGEGVQGVLCHCCCTTTTKGVICLGLLGGHGGHCPPPSPTITTTHHHHPPLCLLGHPRELLLLLWHTHPHELLLLLLHGWGDLLLGLCKQGHDVCCLVGGGSSSSRCCGGWDRRGGKKV